MQITFRPETIKRQREYSEELAVKKARASFAPVDIQAGKARLHNLPNAILGIILTFLSTRAMNSLGGANQWLNKNIFGKMHIRTIYLSSGRAYQHVVRSQPPLLLFAIKKQIESYQSKEQAVTYRTLKKLINSHKIFGMLPCLDYIRHLDLTGSRKQCSALELHSVLRWVPNILTLRLGHTVKNGSLGVLHQCPSLEHLSLVGLFEIENKGLAHLQGLPLKYLNLTGCYWVNDAGLGFLNEKLQDLNLTRCSLITNAGLLALRSKNSLRSLKLIECTGITDTALEYIFQFTALERLSLQLCHQISDEGLRSLQGMKIKSLDLRECRITDAGLEHLNTCTSLRSLSLSRCTEITDNGLKLLTRLTLLENLDLKGCEKIRQKSVVLWRELFPLLRTMRV